MDTNNKEKLENEIDFFKLIKLLLKKWGVILFFTIIGAVISAFITLYLITPKYKASAMMYVNSNALSIGSTKVDITSSELSASKSLVNSYIVILKSRNTLNDVISKANLSYSYEELVKMISATSVNNTEIFEIVVTSSDPNEAKIIANTIATTLPNKIASIIEGSSARIVDSAVTPVKKASPSNTRNVAIGSLLGGMVAVAVIVIKFLLDDEVHTEDDLTENFNIPLLAAIPDLNAKNSTGKYGYGGYYGKEKEGNK